MSFSFEQERNDKLSCLVIEISWEKGKFVTTVYRKPLLVECTSILKVTCQQYTNLVWCVLLLIVVSKFVLIGQSFVKN